jgi:DNA polymerase III sliding clamp (beta) subunit (PCNA family)
MSKDATLNREALLKIASLVRPALATQTFIPAYNHIEFCDGYAMTHNDITAIQVRCDFPEQCCVPGELLIKALSSFSGSEILLKRGNPDSTLVVSCGRSKLKVPTLPVESFPFEMPQEDGPPHIFLDAEIIEGIKQVLVSAGNNPNHPSAMGVTLDVDDGGNAVLFATDNYTISRHSTNVKVELPGDSPIILPTFFCNQLISLTKAFPHLVKEMTLFMLPGALLVEFGDKSPEAILFTKTIDDAEPLDFHKILRKHVDIKKLEKLLAPIPDAFDSAFSRQLLVLGNEMDKATKVTMSEDGTMRLRSSSQTGESDESFPFDGDDGMGEFHVDPTIVVRGSKLCDQMYLGDRVLVMAGNKGKFLHVIAHVSAPARAE